MGDKLANREVILKKSDQFEIKGILYGTEMTMDSVCGGAIPSENAWLLCQQTARMWLGRQSGRIFPR